ncbi:MAG TPA: hypothetical protein VGQ11_10720 [Candidatus Acidoferrales bacterium]|jgi:hypothetical protein|nr:hypothetical protein [Candidatus Acidoferrales bacterium]
MRLSTPADLFDVIREALHAARLGRIQPGQAYAVGYLATLWLRAYHELSCADREAALQGDYDYMPDLAAHDGESVASVAATSVEPLPPTPDSPILDALEEKREKQMARPPSLFSFLDPDPSPALKGLEKRLTARILQEMSNPSPPNGDAK